MKVFGLSDVGKKRRNNEDSYLIEKIELYADGKKRMLYVLGVADGMGGHKSGEVASKIVVERLSTLPFTYVYGGPISIRKLIEYINRKIYDENMVTEKNMGTTLVGVILDENHIGYIFNVGDSRAYLYRKGNLLRLTKDHSVVQEMIDRGEITEKEAANHPDRHKITMAIGTKESVSPDIYNVEFMPGDILLLCTDGVHDMLGDMEIRDIIMKNKKFNELASEIVSAANEKGGEDNITVITARF